MSETTVTAEVTELPTITVRASRVDEAQARIDKANTRLAKAGITERFSLTVEYFEIEAAVVPYGPKQTFQMAKITLNAPAISYNGWKLAGTLVWEEAGVIVHAVPGIETPAYRPTSKACDQCHTARDRNETFLVINEAGEQKQVGRSCLALFLGVNPALWAVGFELGMDSDDEREAGSWGATDRTVSVHEVVAAALAVSNEGKGYVSAKAVQYDGGSSTANDARTALYGRPVPEKTQYDVEYNIWLAEMQAKTAEYLAEGTLVNKVIEIAAATEGDSEYAQNVRILAASERVANRNFGFVASFVVLYAKAMKIEAEKAVKAARVNEYVGNVKDKVEFVGTIAGVREMDGQWGTTTLLTIVAESGHTYKWFASRTFGFDGGEKVSVKGTVKGHEEYNGYKSTMLTRCKIEEV